MTCHTNTVYSNVLHRTCTVFAMEMSIVVLGCENSIALRLLWGWRVGNNLPSVLCGIQLIGLPALQVDSSSVSVCPFHLQDGRFTVSHPAFSTT